MNMEVAVFVLTNEELLKILPILMPSTSGPSSSLELRLFNPEDEDNKIFRNVRNTSHIDTLLRPKCLGCSTINVSSTAVRNSNVIQVTFKITSHHQVRELCVF